MITSRPRRVSLVRIAALALLSGAAAAGGADDGLDAALGRALFKRQWVPAPSSTDASDGLGPMFDARSCDGCHRQGGASRGSPAAAGLTGAVVRLGTREGAVDPYYGRQLQTKAVPGLTAEASIKFLPKLEYRLSGPALTDGVHAGVRQAPSLFGRSAFDDISDAEILSREDVDDRDHDGISGRANHLKDGRLGRYDWKAGRASLRDQIAYAFVLDLGMSSALEPHPYGDCTTAQTDCRAGSSGESAVSDGYEIAARSIDLIAAYVSTLSAVTTKGDDRGASVFATAGCSKCHVPALKDKSGGQRPAFTDLLLHDMGPDLDDGIGEGTALSSEWRTAPLIGRNGRSDGRFLHDGSAATVAQAIAKHGGEGAAAREAFERLSPADRKALADYVGQL